MKSIWREILMSVFMGMILPGIVLSFGVRNQETQDKKEEMDTPQADTGTISMLLRQENGSTREMEMDDYLLGVVLAEMPASFEPEALKAQAVASRTYTLKAMETGGKHGDGSVCVNSTCCQAYVDPQNYLSRGGTQENLDKVHSAVVATSGYVLTYQGELIEATYFSCSGGSTEDALAVWGTDYPYLQAMPSPGEEGAAHFTDTVTFSLEEFSRKLDVSLSGEDWLGGALYTEGGGVGTITIGGKDFSGTQVRSALNLRSTNFEISFLGDTVTITTKGFGHRVGMSQYGADAMAVSGSNYGQILAHYYQGTDLTLWKN